jgi:hypothetical protein
MEISAFLPENEVLLYHTATPSFFHPFYHTCDSRNMVREMPLPLFQLDEVWAEVKLVLG